MKKKITLYLNDETVEALDKVAASYDYRKYPINQAYGLILDELIEDLITPRSCSCMGCCGIPAHSVTPSWCCGGDNK